MDKQKDRPAIDTSWMISDAEVWIQVNQESPTCETMFLRAAIKYFDAKRNIVGLYRKESPDAIADEVDCSQVFQRNLQSTEQGIEDMVALDNLNEAEILYNLRKRYDHDQIYTYIGPTLIAINPYKRIDSIDSAATMHTYQSMLSKSSTINPKSLPPHTFSIAAQAYSQLFENMKNQALVISGESGAGKTENTKLAMTFLTSLSAFDTNSIYATRRMSKAQRESFESIEHRILRCNPILEAFGNAKTVRNDNSSRFGKYVRLLVDIKSRRIQGAEISNYLLEKSRVTVQGSGERGYHIFYHLLKGCNESQRHSLHLHNEQNELLIAEQLKYLNSGNCTEVNTIDDNELYEEVCQSLDSMGFHVKETQTIWKILAAILLLGNMSYDASTLTDASPCSIKTQKTAASIATLLDLDFSRLQKCLLIKKRTVGTHVMESPLIAEDIQSNQDSIARTLYDSLFTWLVKKLNLTIKVGSNENMLASQIQTNSQRVSIGLLDIFGFEVFKINSFEQLCINYTNERLQQLYICYVFKSEEQELAAQGLSDRLAELKYSDNQLVIDLLDKYPKGIFDLLDESSSLGSSSDASLYQKICQTHKAGPIFVLNKGSVDSFLIRHTAQVVEYNINGFRNKNKAEVSSDITECLLSSSNHLIGDIFLGLVGDEINQRESLINTPKKPSKNDKFLGAKFRFQMKQLMDELMASNCHFIRCIKPNELKKKDTFISGYAFIQIKYLGVLEAIRVRKEGFPYRKNFEDFYREFGELLPKFRGISSAKAISNSGGDLKQICLQICQEILNPTDRMNVLIGTTKLFAKDSAGKALHDLQKNWLQKKSEWARIIQRNYRRFIFSKQINQKLKSIGKAIASFRRLAAIFKMKKQRNKFNFQKKTLINYFKLLILKVKANTLSQWKTITKHKKAATLTFHILQKLLLSTKKQSFTQLKSIQPKKQQQPPSLPATTTGLSQSKKLETQKEKPPVITETKQQKQSQVIAQQLPQQHLEIELTEVMEIQEEKTKEHFEDIANDLEWASKNMSLDNSTLTEKQIISIPSNPQNYPNQTINPNTDASVFIEEEDDSDQLRSSHFTSKSSDEDISGTLRGKSLALRMTDLYGSQNYQSDELKLKSVIGSYLNIERSTEEELGEVDIGKIDISPDCTIDLRALNESLLKRVEENNYLEFCTSIYKKRTNWGRSVPIEELASFQTQPLKKTLTNISPSLTPIAVKAFTRLLKYAEILKSKRDPRTQLLKLLELCFHEDQSLQDEIFMQIAKQLHNSQMPFRRKFYQAMSVISSFFSTSSRTIYPLLNCFYNNTLTEKDEMNKQYCKFIFTRLRKVFQSPRAYLPTRREIGLIEKRKQIIIPIYVYGDRNIFIAVESYTSIAIALKLAIKELDIESNSRHYCLVEQITTPLLSSNTSSTNSPTKYAIEETILNEEEYIMDVYGSWDLERDLLNKKKSSPSDKNSLSTSTPGATPNSLNSTSNNNNTLSQFQPRIIIKIRNFFKFMRYDIDSIFMYYAHASCDFLNGRYILSETIVLRLILFKLINDYGDQLSRNFLVQKQLDINCYVPMNLRTEEFIVTWQERVLHEFGKMKQLKSTWNQAKARTSFLNLLKKYSILFMSHQCTCHFYTVDSAFTRASMNPQLLSQTTINNNNFSATIEEAILAIKPFEILLLDAVSMDIIETIKLSDISKFGKQASNRLTIIKGDGKTFHLQLKDPEPYLTMINNYINMAVQQ